MTSAEIKGWLEVVGILIGIFIWIYQNREKTRWEILKGLVQPAHRLTQKASKLTKTPKDDLFLEKLVKLAESFGVKVRLSEAKTLKALGSAEHQTYMLIRDGEEADPTDEAFAEGFNHAVSLEVEERAEGNGRAGLIEPAVSSEISKRKEPEEPKTGPIEV